MTDSYGKRLKLARKHAGLTQVQLAKRAGTPLSTLASAETSGTGSSETAKWANACGVSPVWLSSGTGQMVDDGSRTNKAPLLTWMEANNWKECLEVAMSHKGLWMPIPPDSQGDGVYVLQSKDDSNEPRIPNGCWLVVHGDEKPTHGQMAVVNTGSAEASLREVVVSGDIYLKAVNPRYPTQKMMPTDKFCGVVRQGYFN